MTYGKDCDYYHKGACMLYELRLTKEDIGEECSKGKLEVKNGKIRI